MTGIRSFWVVMVLLSLFTPCSAQPPVSDSGIVSGRFLHEIGKTAQGSEKFLSRKSEKTLARFNSQYSRLLKKLSNLDSAKAAQLRQQFSLESEALLEKLKIPVSLKQYIPRLDSLSTSLSFLQQHPNFMLPAPELREKLQTALTSMQGLKEQLQKAEDIKAFLKAQRERVKAIFERLGMVKNLKRLNKQVYYYSRQVLEVKESLKDTRKMERKALELLSKSRAFREFMRKNSMLASLFRLPGGQDDPTSLASLASLQTRAQVSSMIQQQLSAGGPGAAQQLNNNLQAAQAQLNQLKDRVLRLGGNSSDQEMPEGFKPNNQKTKTFLQRLEYGANIQSQKATNLFPVTSDIGLSLGYKLNDRSVIGIGASYKLGWGRGWNHIRLSSEGLGLRSYVDVKLKGSFWISGGYEQNYRTPFSDFEVLRNRSGWQQSGLLGLSKVISLKTKLFKKTSVKLLWDFMSYRQIPRTQSLVFRIGYIF